MGHSYGGFIATYFLRKPEKLRSLALVNAAIATMLIAKPSPAALLLLLVRSLGVAASARKILGATMATTKAVDSGDPGAPNRLFLPVAVGRRGVSKSTDFVAMATRNSRTLRETTTTFPEITRSEVAKNKVPTLVMWGELSVPADGRISELLSRSIPGCEKAVVSGAGHLLLIEKPDEASEGILRFLRAHHVP